ncbi:MAG: XTP/dITP diphosphatase [Candidatus Bathyarchaeota archaeon]|nr:MAG: XTP/dITP diphosphatase [Candidatus Bathyarchaeota archaeon]
MPANVKVAIMATGNFGKFNEARLVTGKFNVALAMLSKIRSVEIQHDDLEVVATARVLNVVERCGLPLVVEDAGLFTNALNGFPGPYSSYAYKTIGNDGLLTLIEGETNRKALFKSVVAYTNPESNEPLCFTGTVEGEITLGKRGVEGFGFDPVFKPSGSPKTFGEMSVEEKNQYSHRARAFRKFAEWFSGCSS